MPNYKNGNQDLKPEFSKEKVLDIQKIKNKKF
jgi:hypothetical protein